MPQRPTLLTCHFVQPWQNFLLLSCSLLRHCPRTRLTHLDRRIRLHRPIQHQRVGRRQSHRCCCRRPTHKVEFEVEFYVLFRPHRAPPRCCSWSRHADRCPCLPGHASDATSRLPKLALHRLAAAVSTVTFNRMNTVMVSSFIVIDLGTKPKSMSVENEKLDYGCAGAGARWIAPVCEAVVVFAEKYNIPADKIGAFLRRFSISICVLLMVVGLIMERAIFDVGAPARVSAQDDGFWTSACKPPNATETKSCSNPACTMCTVPSAQSLPASV